MSNEIIKKGLLKGLSKSVLDENHQKQAILDGGALYYAGKKFSECNELEKKWARWYYCVHNVSILVTVGLICISVYAGFLWCMDKIEDCRWKKTMPDYLKNDSDSDDEE